MDTPLRVLLIEDSESDAALVIRQLKKADYAVTVERVETVAQMTAALEKQAWDCVIADYKLPQFDAPAALAVLQATGLDLPFIVVSGTIGEETAVALMKAGAHDYLMKDKLARLAPAVKRELAEAQSRLERRRAEKRFQSLIEHAPDGIVLVTVDGKFKYISPSARRLFGYGPDEVITNGPMESTHPDDLPAVLAALNNLIQNPAQVFTLQYRFQHKDGSWRWIESNFSNLLAEPSVEAIVINSHDLTELRRADESLRESEQRFRQLFATSPDAIVLSDPYAANAAWPIVDCNEAACQMNGYPREELIGQSIDILNIVPETREGRLAYLDRIRREGVIHVEAFHRHQDGHVFPIEVATSLFTFEGRELVLGIDRDITERKRAEEALLASEARFRSYTESAPSGIFIVDRSGRYVDVNPAAAQMLGYTAAEILRLSIPDLLAPQSLEAGLQLFQTLVQDGSSTGEMLFRRKDSTQFWAALDTVKLSEDRFMAYCQDITERKHAEAALCESEDRYHLLMDTLPDGVIVHSQGRVVFANPASATLIGAANPADLTGKPVIEFVQAGYREMVSKRIQQSLSESIPLPLADEKFVRLDGTPIDVEVSAIPISYAGQAAMLTVFNDITARKHMEAALRQSEARFRALIENGAEVIALLADEGVILYESPSVRRVLGYEPAEMIGHNGFEFLHPDDYAASQELFERLFQQPQTPITAEIRYKRKDDTWCWVQATGTNLLAEPNVKALIINYHDITQRKQAEEALRDKVATLQAVAEIDREITAATEANSILDLVCRRAAELVHAPKSAIVTRIAANEMAISASYGFRDEASVGVEFAHAQQMGVMNLSALDTREVLALNDIAADNPVMSATTAREGARALAIVPLVADDEAKGALIILDTAPRQWQAADLQVLNMLAGQAAIALEKLQLLQAARGHALHLATLNDIGQAVTSSLDLDQMLLTLLDKVREATEAEACSVALLDQKSGDVVFRQAVGGAVDALIGLRLPPGEGLAGWVAQHRQSAMVLDASADARVHRLEGGNGFVTHDLLGMPLIVHEQVTGVIELVNKRSGQFDEDDHRLLESVAAQAAIAIENARLFETERTGREQLEILYRAGQAINSTLDVDSILDRLTDEAMQATHATHGSALVAWPERGGFERRSLRGYTLEQIEQARADWLPLDRGINGRAYYSRQVVYVADVQIDPDYHPLIPDTRAELVVPILRGGQVIGNLDVQSPQVDAFRDVNLAFLRALTDQVAIALENARHFAEVRRHTTEMSIVSEVALVGAAGRPFDETVARATNALTQLWPEASLGFLFLDEAAQVLHPHRSYYGVRPEQLATVRIPTSQGIVGWAVRERQPVRVGNAEADPRYNINIAPGTQSVMAAPLVAGDRVIGVVNVDSPRPDAFSGEDLRLLTTLAGQLATIFEKARLDTELVQHAALLEQRVQERTAELATANVRLTELDQLKSKFVSDVSHELRTPITALSLNVDLLEHGKPEKRAKYMQAIRQQVQREAQLIEDILNLSRLELGAEKVKFAPVALNALIAQIVAVHQPAVDAKNVTLTFTPNNDLPTVRGEENQLAQVITNLIGNAVNYTLTGGITVRAVPTEDQVVIEVRDTGLGIAPEDVPHLFERFYRGGRTRDIRGTGLGLAIAQEIVDLHGGRLEVESEVDVGSTFRVYLPLAAMPPVVEQAD